uniref:Uncharacterized protein n=1 Tax=Rhizophora mucronata TaxID=61149 RepID=A0A2P2P7J5_RHIMU
MQLSFLRLLNILLCFRCLQLLFLCPSPSTLSPKFSLLEVV